jgi:uncharacterized protein YdcH (DUF465 family)
MSSTDPGNIYSFKWNFEVTVGVTLFILCGGTIWLYATLPNKDLVKVAVMIAGGGAAIYGAFYAGQSFRLKTIQDKKSKSFEFTRLFNHKEFIEVRHFIASKLEGRAKLSDEKIYKMISTNSKLKCNVHMVLCSFEDISIAIQADFVDEEILHKSLCGLVLKNWEYLEGYIKQYREKQENPAGCIEFENLERCWRSGKRLKNTANLIKGRVLENC